MDRQTATQLIANTFNYPFDEGRFRNFVINLLNDVNEQKGFDYLSGTYIRHSFKNHITKYRRLGSYTDPNGEKIDLLVVQLKNEWALERSRAMLRNFTSDYLKNRDEKDAALVAYYTTNPDDWRFSYIRMEYKRVQTDSGKFKIKEDITPAKRYSYLVGKNEPNHTAQAQLVGILVDDRNNPTLTELETAFSVDAVTKQFYKDYRAQFEKLWNELNDIVTKDPKIAEEFETQTIDTANFAKKLMGQIVFLYFLQKKGWLGVSKDEKGNFKDWGSGPKNFLQRLFNKEFCDYQNFFNDVLEPLFYEALGTERPNDIFSLFNCRIPFLSGGLFEPLNDYNWEETDILIDNEIVSDIFKTFNQYNFTVREDEPLEKEVAIDPEMLGKVFENLLPENIRKGKGAYYTPRTIVHYMCQESLINYLDTECKAVPKDDIETLIREGDLILELETAIHEEGKKYKYVLMDSIKENAQALDDALDNIKVCDPAIGSGAFPVGMLNEIVKARRVLELYLEKEETTYTLKRHCIQESIYGVDIDPGAIDIAKLRLWLSLVVDEEDYDNIQTLPNLDYKIMQGNSLIEEFHGISLDIEKKSEQVDVFSGGSSLDTLIEDLHQKQADFFNAEHPKDKKKKRNDVEMAIYNIFHHELEKKRGISPQETKEVEADLRDMTHGNKERNFFPWKLYFADVFREKGGFDLVIANPPYVRMEEFKDLKSFLKKSYNSYTGRADLYIYFIELSYNILNSQAISAFITSNKYLKAAYGKPLRKVLSSKTKLKKIINFGGIKIFENANVDTSIILFQKEYPKNNRIFTINNFDTLINSKNLINYIENNSSTFNQAQLNDNGWNFESQEKLNLLNKMKVKGKTLEKHGIKIVMGVKSGLKSVFEISNAERNSFIKQNSKSSKLIKPVIHGKEIHKYSKSNLTKNLLFVNRGVDIKKYPNIYNYLLNHKTDLSKRSTVGLHPWYELQQPQSKIYPEFEKERIIYPDISSGVSFSICEPGVYCDNTTYNLTTNSRYILGLLNSSLIEYFYKSIANTLGNNVFRFFSQYIKQIPIPDISEELQNPIINLVNQILDTKKANPQADTTTLEAEIDQLVYELYGLTEEEIEIVEKSVGG